MTVTVGEEEENITSSTPFSSTTKSTCTTNMDSTSTRRSTVGPYETGPRAWVVIASFFALSFIEMGILKSFGVLVSELVVQFDTNTETLGFIIGLYHGIAYALGPFIAPLSKRKALVRPLMLCGSFIMGLGLSLSSISPDIVWFSLAMAVSGVGFSVISLMTVMVFSHYFTTRFALAYGMGDMGCAVSVIMPLATEKILEYYGWRGTILILGGIAFNTFVFCAIMRDPRVLRKRKVRDALYLEVKEEKDHDCCDLSEPKREASHPADHSIKQNGSEPFSESDCDGHNKDMHMVKANGAIEGDGHSPKDSKENMAKEDFQNDPLEIPVTNEQPEHTKSKKVKSVCLRPFRWLWRLLDWSLCRDEPYLNFIFFATFIFGMITTAWYIFLISHAVAKGITLSRAVLLSLFSGAGDAIGRFSQGPIVHNHWMTSIGLFMLLAGLNSILFLCDPLLNGFGWLATGALLNGMFFGGQMSLSSIMLKESTPAARFSTSYGLSCIAFGFSEPIGGFAAGWISSVLGYEKMFIFLGGFGVVTIISLIPAYVHYCRRSKTNVLEETTC